MNYSNEAPDMGWFTRAVNNQWPNIKLAQPAESAKQWALDSSAANLVEARHRLLRYGTHFVFAYGRNDVSGGYALASIQADLVASWVRAQAVGGVSWQTTITPKTTSSDQWATLGNQTVTANESLRVTLNAWIRDGAPILAGVAVATGSTAAGTSRAGQPGHPLAGYLDVADVLESARDSGKWAITQVRTVADAAITNATKIVTSATAAFTSADLGKSVFVTGAGASGAVLSGVIAKVTDAQTVTISPTAGTTVSGAALQIGAASYDGTHPDGYWHRAVAAVVAPVLAAAADAYTG